MYKMVSCPHCGGVFKTILPDVTLLEVQRLRDNNDDRATVVSCPRCQQKIPLPRRDLLDLPDAQP